MFKYSLTCVFVLISLLACDTNERNKVLNPSPKIKVSDKQKDEARTYFEKRKEEIHTQHDALLSELKKLKDISQFTKIMSSVRGSAVFGTISGNEIVLLIPVDRCFNNLTSGEKDLLLNSSSPNFTNLEFILMHNGYSIAKNELEWNIRNRKSDLIAINLKNKKIYKDKQSAMILGTKKLMDQYFIIFIDRILH